MYVILNDELYHHGIKGQKWGVRRFQNEDGTRTESGKHRYGSKREEKEARKREAINEYSKVMDSYNRAKKKSEEIWEEARAKYESLGPDDASRSREISKAERGLRSKKAAKEYLELSKKSDDVLYEALDRKREAEKRLGKSVVKAYNKARALKDIKKHSIDVEAEKKKIQDAKKNKHNYVDPDGNEWTIY